MRHLKLFEAFGQSDKITSVNNIIVGYFLFNYFVENDICVVYTDLTYEFNKDGSEILWITPEKQAVMRTLKSRHHFFSAFSGLLNDKIAKQIAYTRFSEIQGTRSAGLKYINYLKTTPNKKHLLIK